MAHHHLPASNFPLLRTHQLQPTHLSPLCLLLAPQPFCPAWNIPSPLPPTEELLVFHSITQALVQRSQLPFLLIYAPWHYCGGFSCGSYPLKTPYPLLKCQLCRVGVSKVEGRSVWFAVKPLSPVPVVLNRCSVSSIP